MPSSAPHKTRNSYLADGIDEEDAHAGDEDARAEGRDRQPCLDLRHVVHLLVHFLSFLSVRGLRSSFRQTSGGGTVTRSLRFLNVYAIKEATIGVYPYTPVISEHPLRLCADAIVQQVEEGYLLPLGIEVHDPHIHETV